MDQNATLRCKTVSENNGAAENVNLFRRRHLHWFSASVSLRSRLLRQRRGVVDYCTGASGDGEEMTVGAEGDAVAAALDCLECEELLAGFGVPDHAAAGQALLP